MDIYVVVYIWVDIIVVDVEGVEFGVVDVVVVGGVGLCDIVYVDIDVVVFYIVNVVVGVIFVVEVVFVVVGVVVVFGGVDEWFIVYD